MKQRLADYVADFLVSHGVRDVFSVVGGGAMHLNDAFGHCAGLRVTYQHHEQACAMSAEAYARLENRIAAVCVTTGPGGTNALTGIVGGWLDSIPMFVVSGQVRYDLTARYGMRYTEGLPLRSLGDQEFDIVKTVSAMTKYAVMIEDPQTIRFHLEKAWHLATTGRMGPVWVDIPVNFQGTVIETENLTGYDPDEDSAELPPKFSDDRAAEILSAIANAERPVLYAGNGIRLSGGYAVFRRVAEKLNIPVVTYWDSVDMIETEHPLYVGRAGNMGDRPGNWAIQNADLILAVGTRLSIRQTGYNFSAWARCAKIVMVDIDRAEMKKHTLHDIIPVWADARDFLEVLDRNATGTVFRGTEWLASCADWKRRYPVVTEKQKHPAQGALVNVYAAMDCISRALPENSLTAVSNGACCVVGHQTWHIKKGSRFIINNAIASMGYGLPAAIGACIGAGRCETVCLEGDGSIMMNLQELQTVITNRLPIKIFLVNNAGYHSIRLTQTNLFKGNFVGIGPQSGDVSFPDYRKIAEAFGYPYFAAHSNEELPAVIKAVFATEGPVFAELFTDTEQKWEPKNSAKRLPDGTIVSAPLEDLDPFLPREELQGIMKIPLLE